MIDLRLEPRKPPTQLRFYEIAGHQLSSDVALVELEAFGASDPAPRRRDPAPDGGASAAESLVFRDAAQLGRREHFLECSLRGDGYRLSVDGLGSFTIDRGGEHVRFDPAAGAEDYGGFSEIVLGPALILALALQDVWCLHASAVELGGGILAFVGASGKGKSTLAAALPELLPETYRCVADDVLPTTVSGGRAEARPRFPQLKYDPRRQPGRSAPPLPLESIFLLEPGEPSSGAVAVEPLSRTESVLSLVRHTHSARLFSHALLRRHTDLCARLADAVPVLRLIYPHRREVLRNVAEALSRLSSGASH